MSSPALNAAFKLASDRYKFDKNSDVVLDVRVTTALNVIYQSYDFVGRLLISQNSRNDSSPQITPFAALDRESLEFMHAKLCEIGGTPPALPAVPEENPRRGLAKPRAANA